MAATFNQEKLILNLNSASLSGEEEEEEEVSEMILFESLRRTREREGVIV